MPLTKPLLVLLALILLGNYLGILGGWFWTVWWYDIPMHIAGGAWIALLFFYLADRLSWPLRTTSMIFLFALGAAALVGTLWEFYEYATDVWVIGKYPFGGQQAGQTADTLFDLLNDLVGAFLAAFWHSLRKRRIASFF